MESKITTSYDITWEEKDWDKIKKGQIKKRLAIKLKYNDYIIGHRYFQGNTKYMKDCQTRAEEWVTTLLPQNFNNKIRRGRMVEEQIMFPTDTELVCLPIKSKVICEFKGAVKLVKYNKDTATLSTEIPLVNSTFHCTHVMRRASLKMHPQQVLEYFILQEFHKIFTGKSSFTEDPKMTAIKARNMEQKIKLAKAFLFNGQVATNLEPAKLDILSGIVEKYAEYVTKMSNRRYNSMAALADKSIIQFWDESDIDSAYSFGFMKMGSLPSTEWYKMMRLTESLGISERIPVEKFKTAIMAPGKWTAVLYPPTKPFELPNRDKFKPGVISTVGFTTNTPVIGGEWDRFWIDEPDQIENKKTNKDSSETTGNAPGQWYPETEYNQDEGIKNIQESLYVGEHDDSKIMAQMIVTPVFINPGSILMHLAAVVDKEHVTIIETPYLDVETGRESKKTILILPEMGHSAAIAPVCDNYRIYKGSNGCEFRGQLPEHMGKILMTHGEFIQVGAIANKTETEPLIRILGV